MVKKKGTHSDPSDPLTEELQYLRKGAGCTLARLSVCPNVLAACGTTSDTPEIAYDRIRDCLRAMNRGRATLALWNAFGFETANPSPGLLGDRRKWAAKVFEKSEETIENWENEALEELKRLLPFANTRTPAGVARAYGLEPFPPSTSHFFQVVIRMAIVPNGGQILIEERMVLVSLREGLPGVFYPADHETFLTSEGTMERVTEGVPEEVYLYKIVFPEPLALGATTDLAFNYQYDTPANIGGEIQVGPDVTSLQAIVIVGFIGEPPPVVRAFTRQEGAPYLGEESPVVLNEKGSGGQWWDNLCPGMMVGIYWDWSTSP